MSPMNQRFVTSRFAFLNLFGTIFNKTRYSRVSKQRVPRIPKSEFDEWKRKEPPAGGSRWPMMGPGGIGSWRDGDMVIAPWGCFGIRGKLRLAEASGRGWLERLIIKQGLCQSPMPEKSIDATP